MLVNFWVTRAVRARGGETTSLWGWGIREEEWREGSECSPGAGWSSSHRWGGLAHLGWWRSTCFCHSAIAMRAEVQAVRRKLLILLFSPCVCSVCTGHAAPCVLCFLIHQCVWLVLKGSVQEGRVIAVLETDEKISVFLIAQVQQLCLVLLSSIHGSLWSSPFTPYYPLMLTTAKECLQANQARTSPKGCVFTQCWAMWRATYTSQICIFFIPNTLKLVHCHTLWHVLLLKLLCICSYLSQQNFRPEW